MPQRFRTPVITLLLGLMLVSGRIPAAGAQQPPPSPAPNAIIPEPTHDFGVVKQGELLKHEFMIRNEGTAPLEIQRMELSAPGIKTAFQRTVPPNSEVRIRMEWDTSSLQGEFEAEAVIYLNDPQKPKGLVSLKAVVKAPLEFDPFPQFFFSVYRDQSLERTIHIVNHEAQPLALLRAESPTSHYDVAVETLKPGFEYNIRAKVRPGVPFGRYLDEPVYVYTDSVTQPRLELSANLLVKPDFYAAPEAVTFGGLRLAALKERPQVLQLVAQTLTLTNRSGAFEIARVETDVPALEISRTPASGASERISLTVGLALDRLQAGTLNGTIRVIPVDPAIAPLTIPVQGELR